MQRLKAAFRETGPQHRPGSSRTSDALEVLGSEVLEFEQVSEKPPRALGDDHRIRFSDPLNARREVRRLADDAALLRLPCSNEIPDDDQPSRDPDPDVQRGAGCG